MTAMTIQVPIPDHAAARRAMIESQLRPVGVNHAAVLEAMDAVARERFVPEELRPLAYADRALALGGGRQLAAPAVLGQLLTEMNPAPGERVERQVVLAPQRAQPVVQAVRRGFLLSGSHGAMIPEP